MKNTVLSKIRKRKIYEIINALNSRARIAFRIKNKRVYAEYAMTIKYKFLEKKYTEKIDKGVDVCKKRSKNNVIWMCWLQGIDNAPPLIQSCVRSIRTAAKNSNYEVILLSEETISNYIELPEYIIKKRGKGSIGPAHYTDIIRTELLCKYGGGWIDCTVLCTAEIIPNYIVNSKLFFFQDINWGNIDQPSSILSNWLIFSESNNPILLLTRDLLFEYWKEYDFPVHYFFYHMFFTMSAERYKEEWSRVPLYSNEPSRILSRESNASFNTARWEQILRMTDIHKLNWKKEYDDNETMMKYIIDNF